MDTYNKLMQIMNEKVLKNVSTAFAGSRGKSTEKTNKILTQPAIMNQSNSSKKLRTFASNSNVISSQNKYLGNGNTQSRDKSS
jgi:hypothetical protein